MTPTEIAVISAVIIFGFAAWLIARKRGADEWDKAYAAKLKRQHDEAAMANQYDGFGQSPFHNGPVQPAKLYNPAPVSQADRRLTHARNRVEFYKLELAKALKAKQGGIGIARAKLNDAVNVVLQLEGASK